MNLEEAIKTAIDYEGKVYGMYLQAMEEATDEVGKRVFKTLCDEEKEHLSYLRDRLEEWQSDGTVTVERLDTAVPSPAAIQREIEKLREKMEARPTVRRDSELEMLRRALQLEVETSNFYREMVAALQDDGKRLFERFVEIEEGHKAIVQAEIDCLSGHGYWFDTREFSPEAG
jgi:rubrerythrin